MSASVPEHQELLDRHEYILGRRAELLEQMQSHREQMKIQRKQQVEESEAARHRNSTLLQTVEDGLRGKQLPHPDLLALETRYWASVEESIPAWEHFLLGKGPHPADCPGQPPRRAKQKPSTAKNQGSCSIPHPGATDQIDGRKDGGQKVESDNKSAMRALRLLNSQQPTTSPPSHKAPSPGPPCP
ncbi:hypothetical protein D9C73_028175 [Collichthys lucidus]|uniref:Uncharacterized protein n=1 Tax=Collichthys lucidus TaxID=240159 RepID=A0A4U5TWA6_COLLU|nr:hypothetical protein D9C73_028175 [Collichthys lucidus]